MYLHRMIVSLFIHTVDKHFNNDMYLADTPADDIKS